MYRLFHDGEVAAGLSKLKPPKDMMNSEAEAHRPITSPNCVGPRENET